MSITTKFYLQKIALSVAGAIVAAYTIKGLKKSGLL
ncbi:hypothetical protein VQ7734_04921 [Vibrio quintilis]|uniref:Uncharacterized protein n=1 Tax=Vibrio quintilis TaxID=1117707 RepID=A0A1M7Z2T1_9VIBR|nr:hypothetical protein VQ7734_00851 [Vibrio quintilis]SHO59144.1 hypothetical protein VQ7734_04921 [Vibrio quintilis]